LAQSERVTSYKDSDIHQNGQKEDANFNERLNVAEVETVPSETPKLNAESHLIINNAQNISKTTFITLLIAQAYICSLTNGVLPAIQTYSGLPYGSTTYHLTVTLSSMANPIACFLAFYINTPFIKRVLPLIIGLGTVCAAYIISTAAMSPEPPLYDSIVGKVLIVLTWISFTSLFSYSRACIASTLRNTSTGHKSLFFCGVFTQIGSAFGAIIMFVLVNYTNIFKAFNPCA
jgi:riboflavin transporter 2